MKQREPVIEPCVTPPPPPPPVTSAPSVTTMSVGVTAADARVKLTVLAEDKVEKITGIRKAMVKAMTRAQQVPHFGYDDEVTVGILTCNCLTLLNTCVEQFVSVHLTL